MAGTAGGFECHIAGSPAPGVAMECGSSPPRNTSIGKVQPSTMQAAAMIASCAAGIGGSLVVASGRAAAGYPAAATRLAPPHASPRRARLQAGSAAAATLPGGAGMLPGHPDGVCGARGLLHCLHSDGRGGGSARWRLAAQGSGAQVQARSNRQARCSTGTQAARQTRHEPPIAGQMMARAALGSRESRVG